ncbi:hypothetical protein SDC9_164835 [bioreactor metagenome]|uniref:Uncharacterized protein n=1 Tax=bioreactor metagenome TaxID=1076179 RepID=A0A645FV03_9ZZZZ
MQVGVLGKYRGDLPGGQLAVAPHGDGDDLMPGSLHRAHLVAVDVAGDGGDDGLPGT